VETVECGPTNLTRDLVSLAVSNCEDAMTSVTDAVRVLAAVPQCTTAAVEKLETVVESHPSASALSDLAAAYTIRAQRNDRPSDFVRALDAADRACAIAPTPAARFNRALAQEALGFTDDALASWSALKTDDSPWAKEAQQHHARVASTIRRAAVTQWPLNKQQLPIVAAAGDRNAVEQLVAPYVNAAQSYVEGEVLPDWAKALEERRDQEAAAHLRLAEMIATALAKQSQDRYLLDTVQCIRSARDETALTDLRNAHRDLPTVMKREPAVYARVERVLREQNSPQLFGLRRDRAIDFAKARRYEEAEALYVSIEREARQRRYPSLLARVHTGRGYSLLLRGHSFDALAEYTRARILFEETGDRESVVVTQKNYIAALLREIGDREGSWRLSFQYQRFANELVNAQSRHVELGENAVAATELGFPAVGLQYQNRAVRMLEDELSKADEVVIPDLRTNLGVALFRRAWIHARLEQRVQAAADIAASAPLLSEADSKKKRDIPLGYRARLAEVEAQTLAQVDRPRAIAKLSEAIQSASQTYYATLGASLRIQRAELYLLEGERAEAATDLRTAIRTLRSEDKAALDAPGEQKPTGVDLLWLSYFARSQEAYRRLIRLSVDGGSNADAYHHAESARAYESLQRLLRRDDLPAAFRDLLRGEEPLSLAAVERIVPRGTFLLQYSVHDDRAYVWIIGTGWSEWMALPVGEPAIRTWARTLHRYADTRDETRFAATLGAPYQALLARPLAVVAKRHGSTAPAKLVIVPDRSMHGLPFAALRNGRRSVIEDYAVSVTGSATLYAFSLAQDRARSRRRQQSVLLFADPSFNQRLDIARDLGPLRAARSEVERIRRVYASGAGVAPPLTGPEATVPELIRRAADSTIIHVAAHGIANADVPTQSFLLLAPADDDSGVLDAVRLSRELRLASARLVVLSACSSAGGTPVGPEGLAPLVQPLVAAGVPAVVGTLWSVNDSSATEELLVRFHQHYRDGEDADHALRLAQLDMLRHTTRTHQAVTGWSAFQMNGYASSPFPASAVETRRPQ